MILTSVGNHTFRATGVTAYLKNGGTLEKAAQMANHASTRTTPPIEHAVVRVDISNQLVLNVEPMPPQVERLDIDCGDHSD